MARNLTLLLLNKRYRIGFLFLPFLTGAFLAAQSPARAEHANIHQLYLEDQRDRGFGGTASPDAQKHDVERLAQAKALVASGSLTTADDFHDAAFIYQHSQRTEDYLVAHILAMEAVVKGDARSKWIAAVTLDRYLQSIGKPQVFGSQYLGTCRDGACTTTQGSYADSLVSDQIRKDFCVEDRATQQKNLDAFRKNTPLAPDSPECKK